MKERITKEEVEHVLNLAKLEFDEEGIKKMQKELECFLYFLDSLKKVNTDDVVINEIISSNKNRFRKDEIKEFPNVSKILENRKDNLVANMIQIPEVIKGVEE